MDHTMYFSDHAKCKNYYCGELIGETAAKFNETRASGLFRLVQGALSLVIRKADSLIDNETRFNAGKRLNLIQKKSFQTWSYLSALRYNEDTILEFVPIFL